MSEFIEKINQMKERALALKDSLQTEEAAKNALIMPFINALGYDVFNPLEVVPEYIADSRLKKDEKVDYAIMKEGKPIILIECKKVENDKLDIKKHAGQLFKYFTASKAKFIILTNGIVYKFFSDIEEINQWIADFRVKLKKQVVIKQQKQIWNDDLYSYMHAIFGPDVIEVFDMKYNPKNVLNKETDVIGSISTDANKDTNAQT